MRDKFKSVKNSLKCVSLLMLALMVGVASGSHITKIRSDPNSGSSNLYGSIMGGSSLFIEGIGFDHIEYDMKVFIGIYPCPIDQYYTTAELVQCTLPNMFYSQHSGLQVVMFVKNVRLECTYGDCTVDLRIRDTPILYSVDPQALYAGDLINIRGIFRAYNASDLNQIRISGRNCILSEDTLEGVNNLHFWYYRSMACTVPSDMEVGDHVLSVKVSGSTGNMLLRSASQGYPVVGHEIKTYNVRVHPRIISISASSGFMNGQLIEIVGYGFGEDSAQAIVTLSDVNCKILAITNTKISCELQPRSSQFVNKYFLGGAGLRGITSAGNNRNFSTYWKTDASVVKYDKTWLSTENYLNEDNYHQKVYGIFVSKAAGDYIFKIAGDDQCAIYFSKTEVDFSKEIDWENQMEKKCEVTGWTDFRDFYDEAGQSCVMKLEKDTQYFIYLFQTEGGGGDYLTVSVETPNSDPQAPNQSPQIQEICIENHPIRQVFHIELMNPSAGKFRMILSERDPNTQKYAYFKKSAELVIDATDADIANRFRQISGCTNKVVKVYLDAQKEIVDASKMKGVRWTFTMECHRSRSMMPTIDTEAMLGAGYTFEVKLITEQSDAISGRFKLQYGEDNEAETTNYINYNYSGNSMRTRLQDLPSLVGGVSAYTTGSSYDGRCWFVSLDCIKGNGKTFVVVNEEIEGGNTPPEVKITVNPGFKNAVSSLVYLPIPSEFLRTFNTKPQVVVKVGKMYAGCEQDDCSYELLPADQTPTVLSFVPPTGKELVITLKDTAAALLTGDNEMTADNSWVKFGNFECKITSVALPTIKCDLGVNEDGSPQLEAGVYKPFVHMVKKGYFLLDKDINEHKVDVVITDISPKKGSTGGGTPLTIKGKGFALGNKFGTKNAVTVNGLECEILDSYNGKQNSNTEIYCMTPEKKGTLTTTTVEVTVNGLKDSSEDFKYDVASTPTVTSLSPNSSSPVLKKDLVINGTAFGQDKSKLTVWLIPQITEAEKAEEAKEDYVPKNPITHKQGRIEYPCNVVSSTETAITCRLSGGRNGNYKVRILLKDMGYSIAGSTDSDKFTYEIIVNSITPNKGSPHGGTTLIIEGQNFSPVKQENQVIIGDSGMDHCTIINATPTQLTCVVNKPAETLTGPQDVYVVGRAQEEATCKGTCKFTFDSSSTAKVTKIEPVSAVFGNTITITGTGFTETAANTTITVGGTLATEVNIINSNKLTFKMPAVIFGSYEPKIKMGNFGYAEFVHPTGEDAVLIMLKSEMAFSSVSPNKGSRYGSELVILGNGFSKEHMGVKVDNKVCDIEEVTFTSIKCRLPAMSKRDIDHEIVVTFEKEGQDVQKPTCTGTGTCTFQALSLGPKITTLLPAMNLTDPNSVYIPVQGTRILDNGKLITDPDYKKYEKDDVTAWLVPVNREFSPKLRFKGDTEMGTISANFTFEKVPAGVYKLEVLFKDYGYADFHSSLGNLTINPTLNVAESIKSSLAGNSLLTFTGKGFASIENQGLMSVNICGLKCQVESLELNADPVAKTDKMTCRTPQINTHKIQNDLNLRSPQLLKNATYSGDRGNTQRAFDGDINTYYYGASDSTCELVIDYGENVTVSLTKLRFFPRLKNHKIYLVGTKIQFKKAGEGQEFKTKWTIDENAVENWNNFYPDENENLEFRYVRFTGGLRYCFLAEVEIYGYEYAAIPNFSELSHDCPIEVEFQGLAKTVIEDKVVNYSKGNTPEITEIFPRMGTILGGTEVTVYGKRLTADTKIYFDGILCENKSTSSTYVKCVTKARPDFTPSTLKVTSDELGDAVTHGHLFLYIDRWSSPNTWGGEAAPRKGDSVHVPKGQILLVDVSPPELYAVIVEGTLIFADEKDMEFHAWFILVKGGRLEIGTEKNPHLHKLVITMYGDRFSKMLPGFGNKGIFVQDGQIDIHGKPVKRTWTTLAESAGVEEGKKHIIVLSQDVDWKAGDVIIVVTTSRNREQTEEVTILSVAADKKTITLTAPLKHKHFSGVIKDYDPEKIDTKEIELRGEVGLLTRNIKIQGDPTTFQTKHGAHVLVRGAEGSTFGRFSYIEVYNAGQLFQLGRYPLHFHMIGNIVGMYVRGCAVHLTYNRGTTIHGVHFLVVEWNVYYLTMGHTIFAEDGVETNNIIRHNLVSNVFPSSSMLMSDMSPAGFWQARPSNIVIHNRFVASAGNGTWFELVSSPTGPSSVHTACSNKEHLNQFDNNIFHSNGLGLKVYPFYVPLKYPCRGITNMQLRDPFSTNPGQPALFRNNLMYMNSLGTFGKQIGAVVYKDIILISNATNQSYFKPNAHDTLPRIDGGISIGDSLISDFHQQFTTRALGLGQKDGFLLNNVRFYNFSQGAMFSTCAGCGSETKRVKGIVKTNFNNVRFTNVTVPIIQYRDALIDKDLFYDFDGSFIRALDITEEQKERFKTGGWITPWFKYMDNSDCIKVDKASVANYPISICSKRIGVHKLCFVVLDNANLLYGQDLKIFNLAHTDYTVMTKPPEVKKDETETGKEPATVPVVVNRPAGIDDHFFGIMKFRNLWVSKGWRGWCAAIPTDYSYNIHFGAGVEFKKLQVENDYHWGLDRSKIIDIATFNPKTVLTGDEQTETTAPIPGLPIVGIPELPTSLRHNHTEHRELYDNVFHGIDNDEVYKTGVEIKSLTSETDLAGASFGDYFYDSVKGTVTWKLNEKRIGKFETEAIYCRDHCPEDNAADDGIVWKPQQIFHEVAAWPTTNKVPVAGDEAVIEETWDILLKKSTPILKKLTINGRLTFAGDVDDLQLLSHMIEIGNNGQLLIGTKAIPHSRKASIKLFGKKNDKDIVISPEIPPQNKGIVNKGKLHIYAEAPKVLWTKLKKKIVKDDVHFYVTDLNHEWEAGFEVVIASSSTQHDQYEKFTISEVVANSDEIKINTGENGENKVKYTHWGGKTEDMITTHTGTMDMRAVVGLLTRTVTIESDLDDTWGCSILTPNYLTTKNSNAVQGHLILEGVEIKNCGQRDTKKAAINFNFGNDSVNHSVTKCSFNNGQGWAVNFFGANSVDFSYNFIYNARKSGIFIQASKKISIENNLIIGIKNRENYSNNEFWDILNGINYNDTNSLKTQEVSIRHNRVSSAEYACYSVPGHLCSEDDVDLSKMFFVNNTAHSCQVGWFATNLTDTSCNMYSNFAAYKNSKEGFVQRFSVRQIEVKNFTLADNQNAIAINAGPGSGKENPKVVFKDSTIIGKALTEAPELYEAATECQTNGIYSALFNGGVFDYYFEKTIMPYHNSTSVSFTAKGTQDITNVKLVNFNENISCDKPSVAIRMNNFYQDKTNFIKMTDVTMIDVDDDNKFFFANHTRHLNSPAFCGKRDCTGNYNTLFHDVSGTIFDEEMMFFGFNKGAGRDGDCTFKEKWNGHICNPVYGLLLVTVPSTDSGVVSSPLKLTINTYTEDISDDLKFNHSIEGPSVVTGLIKIGLETRVQPSATMLSDYIYQLQSKSNSDFVIIKVQSENPASMNVYINNGRRNIKPKTLRVNDTLDMTKYKTQCGANYYLASERTLYFILTADPNCNVKVKFINVLKLSTRLSIDPATFYDTGGVATFLDKMAALLGISIDRIKVVDIREGSTIVETEIIEKVDEDGVATESLEEATQNLNNFKETLEAAIENGTVDLGAPVLDMTSSIGIDNSKTEEVKPTTPGGDVTPPPLEESNNTTYIVLGILIPLALIVLGVGVYCCCKNGAKSSPQTYSGANNQTTDMSSARDNNAGNYMINNANKNAFGKHGDIKFAKKLSIKNTTNLDSYIKRKN